jgi:glucose-1-phosphate adenylyltransferase
MHFQPLDHRPVEPDGAGFSFEPHEEIKDALGGSALGQRKVAVQRQHHQDAVAVGRKTRREVKNHVGQAPHFCHAAALGGRHQYGHFLHAISIKERHDLLAFFVYKAQSMDENGAQRRATTMMEDTICLILGGGQGSRLFPLTKDRSKPAVPIGGKFRLIDIPISNSLNSEIFKILVLTQFNSASLNQHINQAYRFDSFHDGFVDILAAEQTMENADWYQGTADAVRKTIKHFTAFKNVKHVLILSGDQIYTMDFREMFKYHEQQKASVTLSVLPCNREDAKGFGIVKMNGGLITEFVEKPKEDKLLESLKTTEFIKKTFPNIEPGKDWVASMGIYLFNVDTLLELLDNDHKDFGKEVIPMAIHTKRVGGYLFNGYWEDVGTIHSFWKANLDFASKNPQFDFYNNQIYTHARYLPSSRFSDCTVHESLVCDGTILNKTRLSQTVIGIRAIVLAGADIEKSIVMGADYYESPDDLKANRSKGIPDIGIGAGTVIRNAIIDKNARIGKNCSITNKDKRDNFDGENYVIRDGIVVVPKNSVLPDGTVI